MFFNIIRFIKIATVFFLLNFHYGAYQVVKIQIIRDVKLFLA